VGSDIYTLYLKYLAIFTAIRETMKEEKKIMKKSYDKYVKLTAEKYMDYI